MVMGLSAVCVIVVFHGHLFFLTENTVTNKQILVARRLRAKIVLFRIQAWNFPHMLRLVS